MNTVHNSVQLKKKHYVFVFITRAFFLSVQTTQTQNYSSAFKLYLVRVVWWLTNLPLTSQIKGSNPGSDLMFRKKLKTYIFVKTYPP